MFGKNKFGVGASLLILLIAYGYNLYTNKKEPSPIIVTKLGKIQGVTSTSREGRQLYEFLGVPFAQPPVGQLRFESPQPVKPWDGVKDASELGSQCSQLQLITGAYAGHEDCLFLNIFVPKERKGLLPVLVFLHGGAFVTGSSNAYRPGYLIDENVILVTVNYRLGALGFLNTGDGTVRGNMGLKDQVMALKFIRDNIEMFGGDKRSVTLFGESAGSASTSFHLVSSMSEGLFSKAIMQSGVFTGKWSIWREPAKQARRFAEKFGCTNESSKQMIECLKNVDTRTLVDGHREILLPLRDQITIFVPTIETVKDQDAFLTEDPMIALKSGKIHKVPILAGVNADEGLLTSSVITANQSKLDQANKEFNYWAGKLLYYPGERTDVSSKIRLFYFGDVKDIATKDLVQNYTKLFSDRMFFAPLHDFAMEYRKHAPLRLYYYNHEGQFSLARILASSQKPYFPVMVNVVIDMAARWFKENVLGWTISHPGVCHADELPQLFDWILGPYIKEGSKDYKISKMLVKAWADWARNDKSIKINSVEWKVVDPAAKHLFFMKLDIDPKMIEEPFADRIKFWQSLNV